MPPTFHLLSAGDIALLDRVAPDLFDNPIDPDLAREFLSDPRHHIAVAVEDAVIVSFVSGVHYIHPDKPAQMWVNEVSTAPTHRRQGLATRLLEMMADHARAIGCTTIWLGTEENNAGARATYRKLGWKEEAGAWFESKL